MGYTVRPGIKRGKPPWKYKHGRTLTGAERIRAMRAKQTLTKYPPGSPKYEKAKAQLEELYSEGINPNQEQTELKDRQGNRVDIHGYTWYDTNEYQEELNQDRYWGVSQANKKRRSYHLNRPANNQERVEKWRRRNR